MRHHRMPRQPLSDVFPPPIHLARELGQSTGFGNSDLAVRAVDVVDQRHESTMGIRASLPSGACLPTSRRHISTFG
jgi:hypothetical protein